jgi:uncharacterized flavoprotein (TIGR03862 family)
VDAALERHVVVVGGGPAGLFAAERLAAAGASVTVYELRRSAGRTLLLAGRSGLNLTHDDTFELLRQRVDDSTGAVHAALGAFGVADLRAWADGLGADTFAGSSGRVFPAAMRGAPLVRAWLARLAELGVDIRTGHRWLGWSEDGRLVFTGSDGRIEIPADAAVLALGGASWPRVGSDGSWVSLLEARGIAVEPLRPANCGMRVDWSAVLLDRHEGAPLKGVRVTAAGTSATGDLTITRAGLEGTPVYSVASAFGAQTGDSEINIDLQPDRRVDEVVAHLGSKRRPKDSISTWLRRAGVQPVAVDLLRDVTGNAIPADPEALAQLLKAVPVPVVGLAPMDRAISSVGGVRLDQTTDGFMLRDIPGVFVAGEMLDWDAPTGGYLLQTCFSTGAAAADGVLRWLDESA